MQWALRGTYILISTIHHMQGNCRQNYSTCHMYAFVRVFSLSFWFLLVSPSITLIGFLISIISLIKVRRLQHHILPEKIKLVQWQEKPSPLPYAFDWVWSRLNNEVWFVAWDYLFNICFHSCVPQAQPSTLIGNISHLNHFIIIFMPSYSQYSHWKRVIYP